MRVTTNHDSRRDDADDRGCDDRKQRRETENPGIDAVFHAVGPERRQGRQRAQDAERGPGERDTDDGSGGDNERILGQEHAR